MSERLIREKTAFPVRTIDFQANVCNISDERKDRWATTVLGKVAAAGGDLHAADAVYHQVCSVHFRTGKQPPAKFTLTRVN